MNKVKLIYLAMLLALIALSVSVHPLFFMTFPILLFTFMYETLNVLDYKLTNSQFDEFVHLIKSDKVHVREFAQENSYSLTQALNIVTGHVDIFGEPGLQYTSYHSLENTVSFSSLRAHCEYDKVKVCEWLEENKSKLVSPLIGRFV